MKKYLYHSLLFMLCIASWLGALSCGNRMAYKRKAEIAAVPKTKLLILGDIPDFVGIENAIARFTELYPNCSIEYEYVQNYSNTIPVRLANMNDKADLFLSSNIQPDSPLLPYALELKSQSAALDLSGTYPGLIKNFAFGGPNGTKLYSVPLGGELRGMFVNVTLLKSLGLSVPQNYSALAACCKALKDAGYIPLQGNPGKFGSMLMYPYICNLIANAPDYAKAYSAVNNCEPGISAMFRDPLDKLYTMVKDGYYNYKYVENNYNYFTKGKDWESAYNFLSIEENENGHFKKDDVGHIAFMPATMGTKANIDKLKHDFHSTIEYTFILAPVGDDGGYAYLSPAEGIAVNKNSDHIRLALEFMNFLFSQNENKILAADSGFISNTGDALDSIVKTFHIPSSHISQLGQVTFRYVFYTAINRTLIDISKANNPKYMRPDGTLYDFSHYMDALEKEFAKQRKD